MTDPHDPECCAPVPAVPDLPLAAAFDREAVREIVKAEIADFARRPGLALRDRITNALWPLLEHAQSAAAGSGEGTRLWMLDCGELVAKHRERAEAAEAERDRLLEEITAVRALALTNGIPLADLERMHDAAHAPKIGTGEGGAVDDRSFMDPLL
jgi:hypothetical protein